MKAYSDDLRIRIVKTYFRGYSMAETAKLFYVSKSFVSRLIEYYYRTGQVRGGSKLKSYPVAVIDA